MPYDSLLVRIYPLQEGDTIPSAVQPLQIGGTEVTLFHDALQAQMRLQESAAGWWLEFFIHSGHVQRFFVNGVPAAEARQDNAAQQRRWPIATLAYTQLGSTDGSTDAAHDLYAACRETSLLAHNACTVQPLDLYETSTHFGYVDGRGTQYISKGGGTAQFERQVLLHALAYACLLTMERLGNRMSHMLPGADRADDLRRLYQEVALFHAKSFFHQPVKLSNGPACGAWVRIDQALGIQATGAGLRKQVASAHRIDRLEAEKQSALRIARQEQAAQDQAQAAAARRARRERTEKNRSLGLTLAGLLLALVNVPAAVGLVRAWL